MKKNSRLRLGYDIATVLRRHQFVAREAAIELWRQGVSGLDIALASSLSDPQRLDLIDAVDKLVKRRNLSNRKENIMSPDESSTHRETYKEPNLKEDSPPANDDRTEFGPTTRGADAERPTGPFNPVSTVIEQDEENDKQREVADDKKMGEYDEHNGHFKTGAAISDEDTARLHVALKDPHTPQDGYVAELDVERDQTPEERQADLDRCCGTDPMLNDAGAADPDCERLTGVDPILGVFGNKKESPEDYATNRDYWAGMYSDLKADHDRLVDDHNVLVFDHDRLVKELYVRKGSCCQRSTARDNVYKLIDGERDYQDHKWSNIVDSKWVPNDWLTFIEDYTFRAREATDDGHDAQMVEIRKIAALAVAAMEHILTPARV